MANSTAKGDAFEKKAFMTIQRLVDNEEFFVPGKRSKVFWKKGYYSEKRKSEIIFDIAIETYIKDAPVYSTLTLIECKSLSRKVSVSDISEFESNIRQVGDHNTKGVFITNVGFQEGAFQSAVGFKFTLIRLINDNEYEWINYRKQKFIHPLIRSELASVFTDDILADRTLIACVDGHPVYNIADILLELKIIDFYQHKNKFLHIPYLSESKIDEIIGERLMRYNVYGTGGLNVEKVCDVLNDFDKVEFEFEADLGKEVLGKTEYDPLKISIARSLKGDPNRWRFTFAHEIGHLLLHSSLLRYSIDQQLDNDSSLTLDHNISDETTRRLEFQANLFARHLLMPTHAMCLIVSKYFNNNNIRKGFLYLDDQVTNQILVFTLLNQISSHFQVSLEAAKVRLKAMRLLFDGTDTSIANVMKKSGLM